MNYNSANNRSIYVPIKNFGTTLSNKLRTDPVGYSIFRDPDAFFDIGPLARTFGPNSVPGQTYMADMCSKNWTDSCELESRNNETRYPNVARVNSYAFKTPYPEGTTTGDFLVDNAATKRFCSFDSCNVETELFNVNDPTSPMIYKIGDANCIPVCRPPEKPDDDILLNKVLNQPYKHTDLLLNMYHNSKNNRDKYKGTRVGQVFELFDVYFQKQCK